MNLSPESLTANGFILMDKLNHKELIPFVRLYLNKWTLFSFLYILSNLICVSLVLYFGYLHCIVGSYDINEAIIHFCYGLAIAFALLPVHEYLHVLAYKSQGAKETSYDANLKKFYFMALADRFVASRKEFQIVALAPFVLISLSLLLMLLFVTPLWQLTILGTLMTHTAFCSGDFGLLSYFDFHKDKEVITYDDRIGGLSYFYGKPKP